jgi:hypothetical protein
MKKVKFTLSFALSLLLMGAGWNNVYGQFTSQTVSVSITHKDYLGLKSYTSSDGTTGTYGFAHRASSLTTNRQTGEDISRATSIGNFDRNFFNLTSGVYRDITHRIEVEFPFDGGKRLIPFFKRTITTSGASFGGIETAEEIFDKATFFPRGTDTAVYVYEFDLYELCLKYPNITKIEYEIWLNYEIVQDPDHADGEGNGAVRVNRHYALDLGENLGVNIPTEGYTVSGKDFTFEVSGLAFEGLSIIVDRNDAYGLPTYQETRPGTYKVTIPRVRQSINVEINYASSTESTGNQLVTKESVWSADGALYINAATPGVVAVYNITGQLVKQEGVSGSKSFTLPKGIYIVKFNGKATKVIL